MVSGNHKRKRRNFYIDKYMTANAKFGSLLMKLGRHDKKFMRVSMAWSRLDSYTYCLNLFERRRREQRLCG